MKVIDSLQRFRRRGNYAFIANSLGILGQYALLWGDIPEARTYLQETIAIGTTHNLPGIHAEWQGLLGLVMLYAGDTGAARRQIEESLRLSLVVKNNFSLARACLCLAETALWEGKIDEAAQALVQSLAYEPEPHELTIYLVMRLFIAARVATAQQQYQRAATLFGLADQMHSQIHDVIAGPLRALADVALVTVREALDPAVFAEAFAAGQQMSLAEAFATVLVPTQSPGVPIGPFHL